MAFPFSAPDSSQSETPPYSAVVRVPKAPAVEWILDLNEEENELVRNEFYYEQVIAIKFNGHLSFFIDGSSSMAGNAEIGEHSLAFTCLQCNDVGAKTSKPVRQKVRSILGNAQEEIRKPWWKGSI